MANKPTKKHIRRQERRGQTKEARGGAKPEWPVFYADEGTWHLGMDPMLHGLVQQYWLDNCPNISSWKPAFREKLWSELKNILGWKGIKRLRTPDGVRFLKMLDQLSRTDLRHHSSDRAGRKPHPIKYGLSCHFGSGGFEPLG